jgi:hypothetical protein
MPGEVTMSEHASRIPFGVVAAMVVTIALSGADARAQDNPYREEGWAKLPDGKKCGASGNIYMAETGGMMVRKFMRK